MKARIFSIFVCLIAVNCLLPMTVNAQGTVLDTRFNRAKQNNIAGEITSLTGKHSLIRSFKRIPITNGMRLYTKDYLFVGAQGGLQVKLKDGSILKLNKKSKIRLSKFFISKDKRDVSVKLLSGKVRLKVSKRTTGGSDFLVKTPSAVAGVRGTDFIVESKSDAQGANSSQVSVLSGKVAVMPIDRGETTPTFSNKTVVVGAFQKTSVSSSEAPSAPKTMTRSEVKSVASGMGISTSGDGDSSSGDGDSNVEINNDVLLELDSEITDPGAASQVESIIESSVEQVLESIVEKNIEVIQDTIKEEEEKRNIEIGMPQGLNPNGEGVKTPIGTPHALPTEKR
jgi:hypothetical protein